MQKCRELTFGEGSCKYNSDIEELKHKERTGLETPVVYAVNDECYPCFDKTIFFLLYSEINLLLLSGD